MRSRSSWVKPLPVWRTFMGSPQWILVPSAQNLTRHPWLQVCWDSRLEIEIAFKYYISLWHSIIGNTCEGRKEEATLLLKTYLHDGSHVLSFLHQDDMLPWKMSSYSPSWSLLFPGGKLIILLYRNMEQRKTLVCLDRVKWMFVKRGKEHNRRFLAHKLI